MDGLVGSRFAPITESIGFVGAEASVFAETLADGASGFHVAPRIDHLRLLGFDADDLEGLLQQRVEPGGG